MSEYHCAVVQTPGTQTSFQLQRMFDAWAGTAGVRLFPGTAYLCADSPVEFPDEHISLADFEGRHSVEARRTQRGYAPRLYPVALGGAELAWVFRWSDDDARLKFIGDLGDCPAEHLLEVIARVSLERALHVPRLILRFTAV